uniref:FERM domain-containing protein n=1 Tax=Panagrolaimus sp. JU765 TaxID=591449 RepID=A0AC34R6J7_9BILA
MADQNPADTSFGGTSILSRVASFRSHRYTLLIQLLDETEQLSLQFKGSDLGQKVLDSVCGQLDIIEKDYFGLRYQGEGKNRYWLDLTKPLNKQFKAVLGDYDENVHLPGYVSEYKLLLKQTERLEERIAEAHKQLA